MEIIEESSPIRNQVIRSVDQFNRAIENKPVIPVRWITSIAVFFIILFMASQLVGNIFQYGVISFAISMSLLYSMSKKIDYSSLASDIVLNPVRAISCAIETHARPITLEPLYTNKTFIATIENEMKGKSDNEIVIGVINRLILHTIESEIYKKMLDSKR